VTKEGNCVIIDPRTLRPVTTAGSCHLIPERIKYGDPPRSVSNRTVPLDGPFDNKIGSQCDHHLKAYLNSVIGDNLKGEVAFEGGSQKIGGTLVVSARKVRIKVSPSRRRWKPSPNEDWLRRALGMRDDGLVKVTGFVGQIVDVAKARLSMVNSAFLVLHYLGRRDFGREFDWARALLNKVVESDLDQSDVLVTEQFTELLILLATEKLQGHVSVNPGEFRNHYRPDVDMPDGVLEDFPNKCVTEDDEAVLVRLPYGKGLRGVVRFPKKP
jgi:hypothetical protein